jgi:zinc transport system substrate-binding protein
MPGRPLIRLRRRLLFSALGVSLAFVAGCQPAPPAGGAAGEEETTSGLGDGGLRIAVSLPPLAWAAAALAPEGSSVTLLLDAGASPHGATLTASRARALAEADLVLLVGWNFEPAMERILVADRRPRQVLRLSEVVAERGLTPPPLHLPEGASEAPGSPEPDHGQDHVQDHGHGHGPDDPHAWLDPLAMEAWVEALGERLGAPRETIDSLRAITSEVDARYREGLGPLTQRALVSHHDGLGWLARRYDLEVLAVLSPEGLVETRPSAVRRVAEAIQGRGLGALFIEPQFGDRAALRIRDLTDVELVTLDPVGTADWPATMRANLEQLQRGLSAPPPGASPLAASPRAAPLPAADRKGP